MMCTNAKPKLEAQEVEALFRGLHPHQHQVLQRVVLTPPETASLGQANIVKIALTKPGCQQIAKDLVACAVHQQEVRHAPGKLQRRQTTCCNVWMAAHALDGLAACLRAAVRSARPMHQLCAITKLVAVALSIVALAIVPMPVASDLAELVGAENRS